MAEGSERGPRRRRSRAAARRGGESGQTLGLVVLWPSLITAVLLLLVHTLIVVNAQSEAEAAASRGLRAAWRALADESLLAERLADGTYTANLYVAAAPHPATRDMAEAARDAVAQTASTVDGWRWWTPGVTRVYSNWCAHGHQPLPTGDPADRPAPGETGWVRVVVAGEVFGPLAAVWPDRFDRVYAAAEGPAVLTPTGRGPGSEPVPAAMPAC